jgi:hypothetical protein
MTEPRTETLDVPGASLRYDTRGRRRFRHELICVRIIAALAPIVLLVAAGACGGDDDEGQATASGVAIEPEAQQRAESINLTLADFPDGWRIAAPESDDDTGREVFNECISVDSSGLTRTGDAESKDFFTQGGQAEQASSAVVIFDDEQQAEDAMSKSSEGFGGSAAEDCFQDVNERAARAEGDNEGFFEVVKFGEVDIGELSFTPPDVDEAQAWQIVIPLESTSGAGEGLEPNFYLDLVLLREGDTTARLLTQKVVTEFDRDLRDELIQTLAHRMTHAAA